jgi:putative ABC transport system substrate-binding protein
MDQLEAAFAAMVRNPVEAISVFSDGFAVQNRDKIIGFGMKQGIPVVSGWAVFAQSGAICTYGPRLSSSYRRLAFYVSRILGGASPADLPIEQPVTFELVVNMKSARQLGLTLPTAVVARADDVID